MSVAESVLISEPESVLNYVSSRLEIDLNEKKWEVFAGRLTGHYRRLFSVFFRLYGHRSDFTVQLCKLVINLAESYSSRCRELQDSDMRRENNPRWFKAQKWVGMALYTERFAGSLQGIIDRIPYFNELGVNLVHLMPLMKCPSGASDGGYAVSDFLKVRPEIGTVDDLQRLASRLHSCGSILTLDVVLNHTSDEHEWAIRACNGESPYKDYYYLFDSKEDTVCFEQSMPEIFPETSPGNFTFSKKMKKWVMTVFNSYQWDLNYTNPSVFIEMVNVILSYANMGADILRLDAVAFLWKSPGTSCQNLDEAHLILQLMRICCEISAQGTLLIAEAIVSPEQIVRYLGKHNDEVVPECHLAYNATFMALLWDSVATKNCRLLYHGLNTISSRPKGTSWLNYIRCHDDIGFGFSDDDIVRSGYTLDRHRYFLINYFTGSIACSEASGLVFGWNETTGDGRVAGTTASLTALESAVNKGDSEQVSLRINQIILLHSLILAYEGIPLLYYGDETGTFNDYSFTDDPCISNDNRWVHRPVINWQQAVRRKIAGTVEHRIFTALKRLIAIRKNEPAFCDSEYNIRPLQTYNDYVISWFRPAGKGHLKFENSCCKPAALCLSSVIPLLDNGILVVANMSETDQAVYFPVYSLCEHQIVDLISGDAVETINEHLIMEPFSFYWLTTGR